MRCGFDRLASLAEQVSDRGGRTAAILYSVTASARRHGLDPFIYLRDILANIGSTPLSQLDQFPAG